ncbi:hypothetical protein [Streptomyces sp. VMFN-G11Ma]|uniref:hypothetical protein n=1 Tax=Streptomyces sp. VMFN-G11Ma TaxID=2135609 RepID=UPI000D3B8685|nr:hypothetical protein [Streptomyces sp. VMFN-G11Ma]PTM92446.1 hypothetical protein C7821_109267 [Streptomyces sp. VMFN-G11Ma]
MGDRHSDGSARAGRRGEGRFGPVTESLIADAVRSHALDTDAEQRAVAAFRAARDAGAHGSRTRRRDDWRPREHRRVRRSLRITFTLSLACLTLGGVAFAAIDSVVGPPDGGHADAHSTQPPATTTPRTPGPSAPQNRPATAKDTEAHCRAYEKKLTGHGKPLDSTAWHRLITAAGGKKNVPAYCTEQLRDKPATAPSPNRPGNGKGPTKPEKTAKPERTDNGKKADKGADKSADKGSDKGSDGNAGQGNGKSN